MKNELKIEYEIKKDGSFSKNMKIPYDLRILDLMILLKKCEDEIAQETKGIVTPKNIQTITAKEFYDLLNKKRGE